MTAVSQREDSGVIGGARALGATFPIFAAAPSSRPQSWRLNTASRTGIHDVAPAPDGVRQRTGHRRRFVPAADLQCGYMACTPADR